MTSGYMVVARDGKEYGPLDRDTIQRWYFEGQINRNSKVWEPGKEKFKLHEMFDLTLWSAALVNTAPPGAPPSLSFQPGTTADAQENERTPGMLAAGILLIVNSALGLLALAVLLIFKLDAPGEPSPFVVPILDLIVAVGLLRGRERFRKWGLFRAVIGGGLTLLRAPFAAPSPLAWVEVLFQIIFCVGIAALLIAESASKLQVGMGVAAVLIAWSGIFTANVVAGVLAAMGARTEAAASYSPPPAGSVLEAGFEDLELGIKVRLPPGWALITTNSPVPDATLVASHAATGCGAALISEPALLEAESLDEYLSRVMKSRLEDAPDMKELGRNDLALGGNTGRMVETSWTSDGQMLRGFTSVCKAGWRYYVLTGWCLAENHSQAFAQYLMLESAFQIDGGKPLSAAPPEKRPRKREASKK